METDASFWSTLIGALIGAIPAVVAAGYVMFANSARNDNVENWKDVVVKSVEDAMKKILDKQTPTPPAP